jgi:hypothetical protein
MQIVPITTKPVSSNLAQAMYTRVIYSIPETSIYKKGDGVILSLWAYTSLFVKWCGHARVFHMWVRCMWTTFLYISVRVMVLNATFNNSSAISWWSVLFVEDTGVPEENYRPVSILFLFQRIFHYVLELFWRCGIFRFFSVIFVAYA